jgi:hypothetical protein
MAQFLPDAQLPLAGRARAAGVVMAVSPGHESVPRSAIKIAFPAKAGTHFSASSSADQWVPAFAGNAVE